MARLVGRARALNMILFSRTVNSREALEMGLIDKIVPPERLMEEANELVRRLAERPPIAVHWVLKAIAAGEYEALKKGLAVEAQGRIAVRTTKDREEGFRAFLEKHKPVFKTGPTAGRTNGFI